MANASRDENSVPTLLAASSADGKTTLRILADAASNRLMVNDGTSGTDHGPINSPRDENGIPALIAVSSADGFTPVVVYADSSGNLLIQST